MRKSRWTEWTQPGRLIPLLTIGVAGTVEILAAIHVFQFKLSEHILILLLCLLAVDSLAERISLLEGIKERLGASPAASPLKRRSELPQVGEQTAGASEILLLAVSGVGLIEGHRSDFKHLLEEGCTFRVVILDPESPYVETWNNVVGASRTRQEIESVIDILDRLNRMPDCPGRCEVLLSKTPPPFSLFAINPKAESGTMCIDFHTLDIRLTDRPLVHLYRRHHRDWYDMFTSQFEQAWSRAKGEEAQNTGPAAER
jgi:hypothetical protein